MQCYLCTAQGLTKTVTNKFEKVDKAESILQGYDVTRWDPMRRQQGDKHAEPCDGKVNVEQPGQKLERVGRPSPAVGSGAERHSGPLKAVVSNWRCAVRVLGA